MHVLIVYAHPEPTSFNAALKDAAIETIGAAGHNVEVSDLYAEGFNPVAGRHDFSTVADQQRFHYQSEQLLAARSDGFSDELKREQNRLLGADIVILQFPLWWGGPPAILKGWFDRVLAYGFAYAEGRRYDQGLFKGRYGIICVTTGGTEQRFSKDGEYGDIERVLWPVRRLALEYLGLVVEDPTVCYATPRVDEATRADYILAWKARISDTLARAEQHQIHREPLTSAAELGSGSANWTSRG